jgi:DNA-directed RNA polymerase specialized sigma24 family protein
MCEDDAEDAVARALEIALTKAPSAEPTRLAAWLSVVVWREALAVRRARQRALGIHAVPPAPVENLDRLPGDVPSPAELFERRERVARAARLLRRLKPQERLALALQAEGHSYAEIQAMTGWTYTKVNRCLAEGRARLRQLGAL